jgi:DNA polymerase III subunit epsilon
VREIVLDTETTGLDPTNGHRLIEIGCIELVNRIPTGHTFHRYVNPEREIPPEAFAVHGISAEFLKDKPGFATIADDLIDFLGDAPLVIHNAAFDLAFLNAELERAARPILARERLVDTLLLARRKYPAGPNRLDDLCARYGIDNSRRTKHGALLDAELLAEVYVELIGARQAQLVLVDTGAANGHGSARVAASRVRSVPLPGRVTPEDREAHRAFVATLGPAALWLEYSRKNGADDRPSVEPRRPADKQSAPEGEALSAPIRASHSSLR